MLLNPQTSAYIDKGECSIYTSISGHISSVAQITVKKLSHNALAYTVKATTENMDGSNKTTFSEYINPENIQSNAINYKPEIKDTYGKKVVVTGMHNKDVAKNFAFDFYLPKPFSLTQQEDTKTVMGEMTTINRSQGYTILWNKDENNKQGVLITIDRELGDNSNYTQLGVTAIRYIAVKDAGQYTITADDLKDMAGGIIHITMQRGCVDYKKVAPLSLPVEIFAYHSTSFKAKIAEE